MALIDFGPCRAHPLPGQWFKVSAPMCAHCEGIENVDQAAGRIILAEYRKLREAVENLKNVKGRHNAEVAYKHLMECLPNAGGMARELAAQGSESTTDLNG